MQVLKSRYGQSDIAFGVGFYGEVNHFKNIPAAREMTENDYIRYKDIKNLNRKDCFIKVDENKDTDKFVFKL